jgi:purine-binding chemotaxis protein CheW
MKLDDDSVHQEIILQDYFDGLLNDVISSTDTDKDTVSEHISTSKKDNPSLPELSLKENYFCENSPCQNITDTDIKPRDLTNESLELKVQEQKIQENKSPESRVESTEPFNNTPSIHEKNIINTLPIELTLAPIPNIETATPLTLPSNVMEVDSVVVDPNNITVEPDKNTKIKFVSWAQKPFECLIFCVSGLKLAVPLVSLGGIFKVENKPAKMVDAMPWSLCLLETEQGLLQILDTAQLIMPEKRRNLSDEGFSFSIRLGESSWALGCQEVNSALTVDPSQVSWRSNTGTRPWLAGTVKTQMCALIDVDGFIEWLSNKASN